MIKVYPEKRIKIFCKCTNRVIKHTEKAIKNKEQLNNRERAVFKKLLRKLFKQEKKRIETVLKEQFKKKFRIITHRLLKKAKYD